MPRLLRFLAYGAFGVAPGTIIYGPNTLAWPDEVLATAFLLAIVAALCCESMIRIVGGRR